MLCTPYAGKSILLWVIIMFAFTDESTSDQSHGVIN